MVLSPSDLKHAADRPAGPAVEIGGRVPPSAGNALGLDRLIALCLSSFGIADVTAFPAGWL